MNFSSSKREEPNREVDVGSCRCSNSPGERYLTSGTTIPNNLLMEDQTNDYGGEELMHVLVTRPEIASKPRDNIVFEGDMDLKTTFETSYEALARMRLKSWKLHQEMLEAKKANSDAESDRFRSGKIRRQLVGESDLIGGDASGKQEQQQQQQKLVSVDHKKKSACEFDGVGVSGGGGANGSLKSRSVMVELAPDQSACNLRRPGAGGCCASPIPTRVDVAVQADLASPSPPKPTTTTATTTTSSSSTTTPINPSFISQQTTKGACCHASGNNQIDPDLTPIIVYDANMNRLERVGLRKRSKYRPSTSLRSGARGLFGDQEEKLDGSSNGTCQAKAVAAAESSGRQQQQRQQQREQQANGENATTTFQDSSQPLTRAEEIANTNHQTRMAQNYSNNTTGRPWDSEPTIKTELALNARNLKDSSQMDYLMYTDGNLPIDCKRKLRNNVNMVDHIKEHNICEIRQVHQQHHQQPTEEASLEIEEPQQQQNCQYNDEEPEMASEQMLINGDGQEDEMLAKQEEEAAVEELQKITENHQCAEMMAIEEDQQADWCIHRIRGTDKSEANKDERNTRLRRTCQNQNFDIYDNEYREARQEDTITKITEERGTRFSPQSKLYTNLFRESPDFILTTGKFLDQEVQRGANISNNNNNKNSAYV